jgi:integral membrane sensor domain MASE1
LWEQGTPQEGEDDWWVGEAVVFLITTPYTFTVRIIRNYRPKCRRNQGTPLKRVLEV